MTGIKPSDYKIVMVRWDDADSHDTWVELKKVVDSSPTECISIGWLMADKPDRIILAASIDLDPDNEQISGHVTIHKPMIKEIKELTVKRPPKEKKVKVLVEDPGCNIT